MRVKCELDGKWCEFPDYISQFFTKKTMIYVSTINQANYPFIQSFLFVNEFESCTILFLAKKDSIVGKNLRKNPHLTLTIDKTHPTDPHQNEGIMVESMTIASTNLKEIDNSYDLLQSKYGTEITSKILGIDDITDYLSIRTSPKQIIHWKGPYFQRFICHKRSTKNRDIQNE